MTCRRLLVLQAGPTGTSTEYHRCRLPAGHDAPHDFGQAR